MSAVTEASERELDRLVLVMSGSLADMPVHAIPDTIRRWLGHIGQIYRLDGLSLARLTSSGDSAEACSWSEDIHRSLDAHLRRLPYLSSQLRNGSLLVSEDIDRLPPEGTADREVLRSLEFGSLLAAPFRVNEDRFGLIAFTRRRPRTWSASIIYQLTVLGRILGAGLTRTRLETRWRNSEQELDAVLTAMPGMAAIVDHSSRIVRANLRWRSRARRGFHLFRDARIGMRFLEVLAAEEAQSDRQAGNIRRGLLSVLGGDRTSFTANYHHAANNGNGGDHYHSRIRPVTEPDGGAVVVFTETEEPDETLKAMRHHSELAHMQRVATISDLAGSIVHELSQPLAAILSNAQAARRLLEASKPDIDAVREMVSDIASTDRRAGDLLHRIHSFLRKGEVTMVSVDLNDLVRGVIGLAGANARLYGAEVALRLDPKIPPVWGDPIQLQQVLLNLLVNALEAMNGVSGTRCLTVRTSRRNGAVLLAVADTGHGIPADHLRDVFKAFYTTKEHGLGMGLAIARTIVLAHGGRLRASNNRTGGATMAITLPAVQS